MADQDLLVRPAAQPFIEPEPPGLLGNAATTRVAAGSLLFAEAGGASGKSVTAEYARLLSDD